MRLNIAIYLGILALSYGYYLDKGCDPYLPFITKTIRSAFDLAHAGADIFQSPSKDPYRLDAQHELKDILFTETLYEQEEINAVLGVFNAILEYNTTSDGSPKEILDPIHEKDLYLSLTSKDLILFCDYNCYKEETITESGKDVTILYDTLQNYSKSRSCFLRTILIRLKQKLSPIRLSLATIVVEKI